MEILNDKKENQAEQQQSLSRGTYNFLGGLMIVAGLVWLGDNYGLISQRLLDVLFSWQMMVVAVGIWLLCAKSYVAGGVTSLLGVLLIVADYFHLYISFERLVLPLMLVAAGVAVVVLKGLKR